MQTTTFVGVHFSSGNRAQIACFQWPTNNLMISEKKSHEWTDSWIIMLLVSQFFDHNNNKSRFDKQKSTEIRTHRQANGHFGATICSFWFPVVYSIRVVIRDLYGFFEKKKKKKEKSMEVCVCVCVSFVIVWQLVFGRDLCACHCGFDWGLHAHKKHGN